MAVTGNAKQSNTGNYVTKVGLGVYQVLGCNLSYNELKELGFYVKEEDLEKERDFSNEKEGIQTVRLEFACKNINDENDKRKFSFFLEDSVRQNKDGNLTQFINNQGKCSWSTNEDRYVGINSQYDSYFTGADNCLEPRQALKGEEDLMLFMRAIFANMDWRNGATLSYNVKKWFNGNFDEINKDLETDFSGSVIVANTVKVKETEEGDKNVESFYNKVFAPGSFWKVLNNKGEFKTADVESIQKRIESNKGKKGKDKSYINPLEEMIVKIADSEYGCKDIYYLGKLKEFNPEEFAATSDKIIQEETSDY